MFSHQILFNLTRGTWGTLVTVTVNTQENKQTPQEKLHKQSNTGRKLHKQSKKITQTPEPGKKKIHRKKIWQKHHHRSTVKLLITGEGLRLPA